MDNDKRSEFDNGSNNDNPYATDTTTRARNRTVMLTPEVTGQVRARLMEELDPQTPRLALGAPQSSNLLEGASNPAFSIPEVSSDDGYADSFVRFKGGANSNSSLTDAAPNSNQGSYRESNPGYSSAGFRGGFDLGDSNAGYQAPQPASFSTPTRIPGSTYTGPGGFVNPASNGSANGGFSAPQTTRPQEKEVTEVITGDKVIWSKEAPIVGFLVSFDNNPNGEFHVLRSGRLVVTSELPPSGNFLYLADESVSSSHAILRIGTGGEIQVLDQLSEQGTRIRRFGSDEDEELSGEKSAVDHGDCICFGNRRFHVCIVPVGE
jgi:hypothetical protein